MEVADIVPQSIRLLLRLPLLLQRPGSPRHLEYNRALYEEFHRPVPDWVAAPQIQPDKDSLNPGYHRESHNSQERE